MTHCAWSITTTEHTTIRTSLFLSCSKTIRTRLCFLVLVFFLRVWFLFHCVVSSQVHCKPTLWTDSIHTMNYKFCIIIVTLRAHQSLTFFLNAELTLFGCASEYLMLIVESRVRNLLILSCLP